MLFGIFNCDDFGSFCAYSMGGDIAEVLEHLTEQAGYNVGPEDVQWFQGVERQLKPIRYEFQD
jgi:hypothetical protein